MITGPELIAFVKANLDKNQSELAHAAGFIQIDKNGKERIMAKQFCEALLEAKGVEMRLGRKPGKTAQFETTVHKTGVILLGKTYSKQFGLKPGDVLDINISGDSIRLTPQDSQPAVAVKSSVRVG